MRTCWQEAQHWHWSPPLEPVSAKYHDKYLQIKINEPALDDGPGPMSGSSSSAGGGGISEKNDGSGDGAFLGGGRTRRGFGGPARGG